MNDRYIEPINHLKELMKNEDPEVRSRSVLSYFKMLVNMNGCSNQSVEKYHASAEPFRKQERDERVQISYCINLCFSGKEKGLDYLLYKLKGACERKNYTLTERILSALDKVENIHNSSRIKDSLRNIYKDAAPEHKTKIRRKLECFVFPKVLIVDRDHTLSLLIQKIGNHSKHLNYLKFYSAGQNRIYNLWEYDYIIPVTPDRESITKLLGSNKLITGFEHTEAGISEREIYKLAERVCDVVLQEYSSDPCKFSRLEAARLLAVSGNDRALVMLESLMRDPDPDVRKQAVLEYYNGHMSMYGYHLSSCRNYLNVLKTSFALEEKEDIKWIYYKRMYQAGDPDGVVLLLQSLEFSDWCGLEENTEEILAILESLHRIRKGGREEEFWEKIRENLTVPVRQRIKKMFQSERIII